MHLDRPLNRRAWAARLARLRLGRLRLAPRRLASLLVALLALCAPPATAAETGAGRAGERVVILVSIDGFRPDYLRRGVTPNLNALAASGARALRMTPSFPSVTFPNHYALVTGLRPDRNGVVANRFEDPALGTFTMDSKEPGFWEEATPIWVAAERQGVRTGIEFWPGSEAVIHGVRPGLYERYDGAKPDDVRVNTLLSWLDRPADARPRFLTLYFNEVDFAGHRFGPFSPETDAAAARVDAAIGRLAAGLKARGIAADLVVVSDHGMAATFPDRVADVDGRLRPGDRIVTRGAVLGVVPADAAAEAALVGPGRHFECWRKADIPARLAYGRNPRVPPVVCLADLGWLLEPSSGRRGQLPRGEHGYDPEAVAMGALFIAAGPDFRPGTVLAPFPNVDVAPLLARLLGISFDPGDGNAAVFAPVLNAPAP